MRLMGSKLPAKCAMVVVCCAEQGCMPCFGAHVPDTSISSWACCLVGVPFMAVQQVWVRVPPCRPPLMSASPHSPPSAWASLLPSPA